MLNIILLIIYVYKINACNFTDIKILTTIPTCINQSVGYFSLIGDYEPNLQYSVDEDNWVINPNQLPISPGIYNIFLQWVNDSNCNTQITDYNMPSYIYPPIPVLSTNNPVCSNSSGSITIENIPLLEDNIYYQLNNNTLEQFIPPTYTYTNLNLGNYTVIAYNFINGTFDIECNTSSSITISSIGCSSPLNCTENSLYIKDYTVKGYHCVCKPLSNFNNFCNQNCYTDGLNYITIEGEICDKAYTFLYDGPCCFDCKNCFE